MQDSTTLAMEAYRDIVSQAASYDFSMGHGEPNPPDAAYSYALAPMCPGSDIPGLLLSCTDAAFGLSYTRIFQYDERSGSVWQPYAVMTTRRRYSRWVPRKLMSDGRWTRAILLLW